MNSSKWLSLIAKAYEMLPKVVTFSDQIEKPKMELPPYQSEQPVENKPEEVKITSHDETDLKKEAEQEEKSESKANGEESYENGDTSPIKQQNEKKKKPLFHKFGSLLKKKSISSQK
ncbi:hypothetical protein HAX54_013304 [Datura stramonium]|uniref:Uncharacterized protein n=1 Tax=Datura stramonium TaxID=4076 RepID=A0ABS8TL59_DATST|nr:hypothetical protein [Datura stramonium]